MPRYRDNNYFINLSKRVNNIIKKDVALFLLKHLRENLRLQIDEDGNRLPDKKESTIEEYKRKGYNTKDWFIRTGNSVQLKITKLAGGIRIYPAGKEILKFVPESANWFNLSANTKLNIIELIRKKLR